MAEKLSEDQIKALWRGVAAKADFSRGPVWRAPIYRGIKAGYEHARDSDPTALTPPDEMYVEFRKEVGV